VVPQSFKARLVRALSFLRAGQAPHFCPGQGLGPVAGCRWCFSTGWTL